MRNVIVVRGDVVFLNGVEVHGIHRLAIHHEPDGRSLVDVSLRADVDVQIPGVEIRAERTSLDDAICRACGHEGGAHGNALGRCYVPGCGCEQVEYGK